MSKSMVIKTCGGVESVFYFGRLVSFFSHGDGVPPFPSLDRHMMKDFRPYLLTATMTNDR